MRYSGRSLRLRVRLVRRVRGDSEEGGGSPGGAARRRQALQGPSAQGDGAQLLRQKGPQGTAAAAADVGRNHGRTGQENVLRDLRSRPAQAHLPDPSAPGETRGRRPREAGEEEREEGEEGEEREEGEEGEAARGALQHNGVAQRERPRRLHQAVAQLVRTSPVPPADPQPVRPAQPSARRAGAGVPLRPLHHPPARGPQGKEDQQHGPLQPAPLSVQPDQPEVLTTLLPRAVRLQKAGQRPALRLGDDFCSTAVDDAGVADTGPANARIADAWMANARMANAGMANVWIACAVASQGVPPAQDHGIHCQCSRRANHRSHLMSSGRVCACACACVCVCVCACMCGVCVHLCQSFVACPVCEYMGVCVRACIIHGWVCICVPVFCIVSGV